MTETAWRFNPQPPRPDWGISPATLKRGSLSQRISIAPPPASVALCLAQGGFTASALVATGDSVRAGQPVARHVHGGLMHAPISGAVKGITKLPLPAATEDAVPCMMIEGDGHDLPDAGMRPPGDPFAMSAGDLRSMLASAGIAGLGGALFPAALKLAARTPIRALIVNGAECEPWITCDEALLQERAASVVQGVRIAMHAIGTPNAVVAIESDMPEATAALRAALAHAASPGIGLAVVPARYPTGGERQLIELLTGDEVPADGYPHDIGYVVHNVATVAAMANFFESGQPLISRIVTVTGGCVARPGNIEIRIGASIRSLVELAGGYSATPSRLIMGGPMMGHALADDLLPVTAATNCIVAAAADELLPLEPERPCIRCGDCADACPARLLPHELLAAMRRQDQPLLAELGLRDCIECGCCDYVCPSAIPLTAGFVATRRLLWPGQGQNPS